MHQLGMKAQSVAHQRLGTKVSYAQQQPLGQKKKNSITQTTLPPPVAREEKSELER